jgi:cytochrome oxidase Cu insertion factor (SCO1/SenC/PrrC family)
MARTALLIAALAVSGAGARAEDPVKIEVGKPAPDFALKDQDGKEVKLSGFRGKKGVLVAFYPKDFTGG